MNIILFLVQYLGFLTLIPFLARNFGSAQGVCLPDTGYVLSYIEDVRTGKNNAVIAKKNRQETKPIDKWYTMNVNIVLTKNYEDQQKPGKKTNPICCSNSLFLS